jgi:hypothetical protein
MTDTVRTQSEILALLADNTTGDISPQDIRDMVVSAYADTGHGWAFYADGEFTSEGDSDVFAGDTRKKLTNDGAARTVDSELNGIATPWVGDTVIVDLNSFYIVRLGFHAETTASGAGNYFDIELDIAGTQQVIWAATNVMAKGANIEHRFQWAIPIFAGTDFDTNGGEFYVTSRTPMELKVWGTDISIARTYKQAG